MNKIIFIGFFLLFLLKEIHCEDDTKTTTPELPPDALESFPIADGNETSQSTEKSNPIVPQTNNGNTFANQSLSGEPTSTPVVETELLIPADANPTAPPSGNGHNDTVTEPEAEEKSTSEVTSPLPEIKSSEPMATTINGEEATKETTSSEERNVTTTAAEPGATSEMPMSSTNSGTEEEEKMTSMPPEPNTTMEEMMPSTESMPEETTENDPMMETIRALEFYGHQIPECVFEMVQINLAKDDLNERWDKSYNQSIMMAAEGHQERILPYRYATAPEARRQDKYQIDLSDDMELAKPEMAKPGGEQLMKEQLEEHEKEEGSEPLRKMLELDGIDYFLAREVRLIKNRYCMLKLLVSLRQVQGHPVHLMPIAISLNKNMTDTFKVLHDFNETGPGHEERHNVMLSIAIDEIAFAKQNPPVDSSMALYGTYVGTDGQNVLVEIQAPRMQMEEMMTMTSSNEVTNTTNNSNASE